MVRGVVLAARSEAKYGRAGAARLRGAVALALAGFGGCRSGSHDARLLLVGPDTVVLESGRLKKRTALLFWSSRSPPSLVAFGEMAAASESYDTTALLLAAVSVDEGRVGGQPARAGRMSIFHDPARLVAGRCGVEVLPTLVVLDDRLMPATVLAGHARGLVAELNRALHASPDRLTRLGNLGGG
jgi:hypothetical protein